MLYLRLNNLFYYICTVMLKVPLGGILWEDISSISTKDIGFVLTQWVQESLPVKVGCLSLCTIASLVFVHETFCAIQICTIYSSSGFACERFVV